MTRNGEKKSNHAFTIIELLVVVGIIAVLMAILVPAVSNGRRQARTAVCMSNVRELSTAYRMYTQETEAKGVVYDDSRGVALWLAVLKPYGNFEKIRICPEASIPSTTTDWGSATNCWHGDAVPWLVGFSGSYGFNGWLYWWGHAKQVTLGKYAGADPSEMITMPVTAESRIPVFGDCNWVDGWPRPADKVPNDLSIGSTSGKNDYMGRFCLDRHGKKVNIAFLDGHVELEALKTLWSLQWSSHFTPTVPASTTSLP